MCIISTVILFGSVICLSSAFGGRESYIPSALLREMAERMSLVADEGPDSYLDFPDARLQMALGNIPILPERSAKDLSIPDYESEADGVGDENPSTALRDQEFLQHSSLWGHQYMTGGAGEGQQRLRPEGTMANQQEIKTDAVLPAYCNPPNPCPVGYSSDDGCLEQFENTAAFSREYQAAQECMCDTEHMFDCPLEAGPDGNELARALHRHTMNSFGSTPVEGEHKTLVAKKYNNAPMSRSTRLALQNRMRHYNVSPKEDNPFLQGEKLPIAAKKGLRIN